MMLHNKKGRGAALILTVLFFVFVSIAIIQSGTIGAISELKTYRSLVKSKYAYVVAEAGIEDLFYRLIKNKNTPASEIIPLNNATATVSMESVSSNEKKFYSKGKASSQYRGLYLDTTKNISASFPYGAQVGRGGITMKNGASINGLGLASGDVYSNGEIEGAPGVSITGSVTVAAGIAADTTASSTACSADETVGRTNPNIDYAQSFIMSGTSSAPLAKVSLYIQRNSNPSSSNIRITADNGGKPNTSALATQALDYTLVGTSYGWVDVIFTNPATLNPETTYWIVLDATQSASKYWKWCRSAASTYAGGSPLYKQDWTTAGTWTDVSGDLAFKVYYGGGKSEIEDVSVSGMVKADTIENVTIGADAYYQTISSSSVGGTSYPGSPTPPELAMPLSTTTIAQWKTDATDGGVINGNCGPSGDAACNTFPLTLGPKKINGNLLVDNGDTLTMSGTLYVTGSVIVSNNGKIKCAASYQGNSCVLVADGSITISNNGTLQGSGQSGSFIMLLTTIQNCNGTGSTGTGCAANLSGIAITNNVSGALFYTTDSMIDISNNATVTAVVGYKLNLDNNTGIIYDSAVSGISFVPDPLTSTGSWNTQRWNEFY